MKRKSVPITQEVRVLRYMRIQAGLSLKAAARKLAMTDGAISHIENGKMHLPLERIEPMIVAYGHSMTDFLKLSRMKSLPAHRREECEKLLKTVSNARLDEVFVYLKSLIAEART